MLCTSSINTARIDPLQLLFTKLHPQMVNQMDMRHVLHSSIHFWGCGAILAHTRQKKKRWNERARTPAHKRMHKLMLGYFQSRTILRARTAASYQKKNTHQLHGSKCSTKTRVDSSLPAARAASRVFFSRGHHSSG